MEINLDNLPEHINQITSYEPGKIQINGKSYQASLIISATKIISDWPVDNIDSLNASHLEPILEFEPDIIILGTGETLIFPDRAILQTIYAKQIGLEIMTTAAACRTYDVLISEERNVVAGLVIC